MQRYQRLKVENFGPIKKGPKRGIIFERCTIFIGDQGTGKSTLVKLFSTMTWLEKSIIAKNNGNDKISLTQFKSVLSQQNIPKDYIVKDTSIIYESNVISIIIEKLNIRIIKKNNNFDIYICPKIQYVPSERNLLSIVEELQSVSGVPEMLKQYSSEFKNASKTVNNIKFQEFELFYDKKNDSNYIITDNKESKIRLSQASSGIQSIFPLMFVSKYQKSKINEKFINRLKDIDDSRRQTVINSIKDVKEKEIVKNYIISGISRNIKNVDEEKMEEMFSYIVNSCFIEIVEEPEQNLFPISQVVLLRELVIDTSGIGDKLILTTHSPYILSEINNYIYAEDLYKKNQKKIKEINNNLFIKYDETSAYKIEKGIVTDIMDKDYKGIDVTEIDECSRNIYTEFDKLVMLGQVNEKNN